MKKPGEIDTGEKILKLLRAEKESYLSGEELSRKFKMTRAAVWKHIHALIGQGYGIESCPHKGYRLLSVPDKLLPAEIRQGLKTKYMARELYCYNESGSTNETAMKLAGEKAPAGTVVITEKQTAGKGRLNRNWSSPAGLGLWFSVILRPGISPKRAADLTFVAGLAVVKAIRSFTGLEAGLKWPNDIYINGKKACGILTEINADSDIVKYLVLGIGINVNTGKTDFPEELRTRATSLALEAGKKLSRLGLLNVLIAELEKQYEIYKKKGFPVFAAEWKKNSVIMNKRVKVKGLTETFEGIAVDIDPDGALVLRLNSGELKRIYSGDVS